MERDAEACKAVGEVKTKFEPILLEHGFTRLKNGYFRLHGIHLQGGVLLGREPFVIGLVSAPYWNFAETDFAADSEWMRRYTLDDVLRQIDPATQLGRGYAPGDPFAIEAEIDGQLACFTNSVLPLLNGMTGLDEYLAVPGYMRRLTEVDLMAVCLRDENFDFALGIVDAAKQNLNERREEQLRDLEEKPKRLQNEIEELKKEIAELKAEGEEPDPMLCMMLEVNEQQYESMIRFNPVAHADETWRKEYAALEKRYALFLDAVSAGKTPEECLASIFRQHCEAAKVHVEAALHVSIEKDW